MAANSFGSRATLRSGETDHVIYRLDAVDGAGSLPFSLKILLENLLRNEDGRQVTAEHIAALAQWDPAAEPATEIQFTPARVILQDLTGVPPSSTWPPCARPCATWAATRPRSTRWCPPNWS